MSLNGVDPAAKNPNRIRRNWNRTIKGAVTSTISVQQPVALDAQNRLILNRAAAGGLTTTTGALSIKLNSTPGLLLAAGGLSILLGTNPGLSLSSGLTILLDTTPGLQLGSGGLSVKVDGTTIEINTNALRVKDGAITGAKFGWASAKGDILVYDGSSYVRLPVGSNGQVLTADSTAPAGVKWA